MQGGRAVAHPASGGAWHPELSGHTGHEAATPDGPAWLEPLPEFNDVWVQVGPGGENGDRSSRAKAAALVLTEILRGEREAGLVAGELATRYEEIDLLYTIADILGRTVRLDEATQTIAREVADVVGARRASIMVYDDATRSLRMVAGRGLERFHTDPVSIDDPKSISARVFRSRQMLAYDVSTPGPHPGAGEPRGYKGASFLSAPIIYQPPGGEARPIGVINLTDRIGPDAFTAGHKKLLSAIANQIGAALENARLVEKERRQVRLDTELVLAQNLQSALMQPYALAKGTDVGVRTQSAEAVGGDFYKILRIRNAVGILVGDVSSHGLTAAMLMTHVIAAAGVIAQAGQSPERALKRLLEVIGPELGRAEMHVSMFYGVIDRQKGTLRYANAGHPQAFLLAGADAQPVRLAATAPPIGLGDLKGMKAVTLPWHPGTDMLCLFSDGFSEAANAAGERYGEERLLNLVRAKYTDPTNGIVDAAFADVDAFSGPVPAADDRTLVLVRR